MINWLKSIAGYNQEKDEKKEFYPVSETNIWDGFISSPELVEQYQILDSVFRKVDGEGLTSDLVKLINNLITNDPILSACFVRTVTLADTEMEINITGAGSLNQFEDKILELTCFNNLQQFARHIIQSLVKYGVYNCQLYPNENFNDVEQLIEPQPETIVYAREDGKWKLIQWDLGNVVYLNMETFVRGYLWETSSNDTRFAIPPLKAALKASQTYKLYLESLKQMTTRLGLQKIIDISIEEGEGESALGTREYAEMQKRQNKSIEKYISQMRNTLSSGFIVHPSRAKVNAVSIIEPADVLSTHGDILASQIITGAKLYPVVIGIATRQNQTTLSDAQIRLLRSYITTIQEATAGIITDIAKKYFNILGKQIDIDVSFAPPELEKELEDMINQDNNTNTNNTNNNDESISD